MPFVSHFTSTSSRVTQLKARRAFSIVEIILGVSLFAIFASAAIAVAVQGLETERLGEEEAVATHYASEGLEALRSIRNTNFSSLSPTATSGIDRVGNVWTLSGTSTTFEKYTRIISITPVSRDTSGNIVSTGGTLDPLSFHVASAVTWNITPSRTNTITLSTYLNNWKKPLSPKKGILVYADGNGTTDALRYRVLDNENNTWNSVASVADIDTGSTNRVADTLRLFSSATRNEYILLSRHHNSNTQYIYAQKYNGTSWSNVTLLASWSSTSYLNAKNFDGTYLANGDFLVVYSDGTRTPKSRTWNGSSWTSEISLPRVTNQPLVLVVRARPGTNEVMMASFDSSKDTFTEYFNGGAYTAGNWTSDSRHSSGAQTTTKRHIDFTWSDSTPNIGALIYPKNGTDKTITLKIFTANGTGSGSWSGETNATAEARLGALAIVSDPINPYFLACNEDTNQNISCFRANTSGVWTTPTNNILTTATDTVTARSYHISYENSGTEGIALFSNQTSIPKLKKYNGITNAFDSSNTNLPTLSASMKTAMAVPATGSDIMLVMADGNNHVYTDMWDGTNNTLYSSGAHGFTSHGTNGTSNNTYWYDFEWEKYN